MLHIALADVICLIAWRVTTVCVSRHAKATMTWFAVKTFNPFLGGLDNWWDNFYLCHRSFNGLLGSQTELSCLSRSAWFQQNGIWMESQRILNGICGNTKSQWYLCNANMPKCHSIWLRSVTVHQLQQFKHLPVSSAASGQLLTVMKS